MQQWQHPCWQGAAAGNKPAETTAAPAAAETTSSSSRHPPPSKAETEAEAKDDAASGDLIIGGYAQVGAESDWENS